MLQVSDYLKWEDELDFVRLLQEAIPSLLFLFLGETNRVVVVSVHVGDDSGFGGLISGPLIRHFERM